MANQQVAFRRVRGHIVPIKINPPDHNKTKGAGLIAGGLAAGAAAGAAAAHLDREAAYAKNASFGIRKVWAAGIKDKLISPKQLNRTFREAAKSRKMAMDYGRAATNAKRVGSVAGAALIGAGVHESLKKTDLSETQKSVISTGAGLGAHFAIRTAYTKVLGRTKVLDALKHAAKRVAAKGFRL